MCLEMKALSSRCACQGVVLSELDMVGGGVEKSLFSGQADALVSRISSGGCHLSEPLIMPPPPAPHLVASVEGKRSRV